MAETTDINTTDLHLILGKEDLNTGVREWLVLTLDTSDVNVQQDISSLMQRFFASRTAQDSTRAWLELTKGAQGQETS